MNTRPNSNHSFNRGFICLIIITVLSGYGLTCKAFETPDKTEGIQINFKKVEIKTALQRLSGITGYEIIMDETGGIPPVTLKLTDVSLGEAFARIFRDRNYTAVWDKSGKKIFISFYESSSKKGASKKTTPTPKWKAKPKKREIPTGDPWGGKPQKMRPGNMNKRVPNGRSKGTPSGTRSRFGQATRTIVY